MVVFFSTAISMLYYLGVMQIVIQKVCLSLISILLFLFLHLHLVNYKPIACTSGYNFDSSPARVIYGSVDSCILVRNDVTFLMLLHFFALSDTLMR